MTALVVGLTVAVALLALLVAGLLRAHAEVLRTLHQMGADLDPQSRGEHAVPVGLRPTPARPTATDLIDLTGATPTGDLVSIAVTGVAHDTLVGFLSSGCTTCHTFWEVFRGEAPDVPGGARLVVVTRGSEAESPAAVAALAGRVPVVMSSEAWDHYDVPYAPYFVYISGPAAKVVGEGVAARWDQVRALVANAVADGTTRPRSGADRARDAEVDRALARAGIHPGDPRLYPESLDQPPA